jgi:hypothetical protein
MFARSIKGAQVAGFGARVGQNAPGQGQGCQVPAAVVGDYKSVLGIDASPAAQAAAPQGATNTLSNVAANYAFAISFTPFCSMKASRIYLPPDVAVQVVLTSIEVAGQLFFLGSGQVPGDLFAETGADFCCSLIESQTCSPSNPFIVRGNTKAAIAGTLVLRGALLGKRGDC